MDFIFIILPTGGVLFAVFTSDLKSQNLLSTKTGFTSGI
jgi:hypothetical protein